MTVRPLAQLKLDAKNNHGWPRTIDHPNDERALLNGCYPSFAAAEHVREFFADMLYLPRTFSIDDEDEAPGTPKGTRPFVLLPWWYEDVLAPLFGWKRADGRRRFDKAFITTAKKSAKSTVAAGLPLYMMIADNEQEPECYAAAVDRDQAGIIYRKTSRAVRLSPELRAVLTRVDSQKRISYEENGGFFEAISSDADSAEGKNPHLLMADELHAWRDRAFFDALIYGDIQRAQPLFCIFTTAGDEESLIGLEEYEFARDLLNPNNDFYSESHFAYIAEAKPDREWDDPEGWKEANPSLGQPGFGTVEKLQAKCDEAKKSPRKQREFIRYICNRWQSGIDENWLPMDDWHKCREPLPAHDGDACAGALDLSKTTDLTALALLFRDGDYFDFKWWFWMPEARVKELEDRDRVPYRDWIKAGWIEPTPGNCVDYAYIRRRISGVTVDEKGTPKPERSFDCISSAYELKALAFDPYNASKLVTELKDYDEITMVEFRQGYLSLSAPAKEFERLTLTHLIRHGNNPVATWMASHCTVDTDPAGNIKPSKRKSRHKIDGIVAAIMAVGIAATIPEAEPTWGIFY